MHNSVMKDRPMKDQPENMELECKTIATPPEEQERWKGRETLPRSSAREGKNKEGSPGQVTFSGQTFWVCFRVQTLRQKLAQGIGYGSNITRATRIQSLGITTTYGQLW